MVAALLEAGANANVVRTTDGVTPLFIAANDGHAVIAQSLLAADAKTVR